MTALFARRAALALLAGSAAAASVAVVRSLPIELTPGTRGFHRLVSGATPSGRVHARCVVSLPGLARTAPGEAIVELRSVPDERPVVRAGVDGERLYTARASAGGDVVLRLHASPVPGARLFLSPEPGAPPLQLRSVTVRSKPHVGWVAALAFLVAAVTTALVATIQGPSLGAAVGMASAGTAGLLATPALLWATLPASSSLLRLSVPIGLLLASLAIAHTRVDRRARYWAATALVAALMLGGAARWFFLPSAGSWDTEYWKAWMHRSVSHGVTRVYGDADAVPEGHFWSQLRGREELWRTEYRGRRFVVDYPPLAMALWAGSWRATRAVAPSLERGEAENVAVKLPPVLGDVLAMALLLWLFRDEPARAATLAALYWALPVSWLSSGVLGFLDGAYAPVVVAALVTAGRGSAGLAGALLALAALVKPQALLVLPAAAVAVVAAGASLSRAIGAGLGVVALALVPFAAAGTLDEAVVHVYRILFQERLSAGFANPWWIAGHLTEVARGGAGSLGQPIDYATVSDVPFPPSTVALPLFALAAAWMTWTLRARPGAAGACLAGAGLVFAYSMFALGVHENHPHAMFLALAATGLRSRRLRILAACAAASYVLNMLSLSVIGRFYGRRYMAVEAWSAWLSELRMAPGFDLTLLLGVVNTILFAAFLLGLKKELTPGVSVSPPAPRGAARGTLR